MNTPYYLEAGRAPSTGFNFDPDDSMLSKAGRSSVLLANKQIAETQGRPSVVRGIFDGIQRVMNRGGEPSQSESVTPTTSSGSSTLVLHESAEDPADATAVEHGMNILDPVLVEPQPGSDYAKMDTPPASEGSLNSYLTRFQNFISYVHRLPWINTDRVTIDYIPGQMSQRNRSRRPILSWYNEGAGQRMSVDLLSSGSSASSRMRSLGGRVVSVEPPPLASGISAPSPVYPNGYVPYQPAVSAYPDAVVFTGPRSGSVTPVQSIQVPNQYPYPVFTTA